MVPSIGDKGIYTVAEPFNQAISENIAYTCIGLRSINDYVINGEDLINNLYGIYGISEDKYYQDLERDELIATLQSVRGHTIQVPCGYITKMPDPNGTLYRTMVISVNVGQIPVNLKLGTICNDIKDLVTSRVGIQPDVRLIELDQPYIVKKDKHLLLERERYVRINQEDTLSATVVKLRKENEALLNIIKKLQDSIINK